MFNILEGEIKSVFFKELTNPTLNNFESANDEINALSPLKNLYQVIIEAEEISFFPIINTINF